MVRLMGAVLVAAGCAWVGFQVSEGMRRRVAELRELARGLALVERELELWAPPLPQLMERAAAHSRGAAQRLFRACYQGLDRLDREDFPTLWRRLVEEERSWRGEERELLAPLGELLGRYDGPAFYFDPAEGDLLCAACAEKARKAPNLDAGALHALRHICLAEDRKLFSFTLAPASLQRLSRVSEQYLLAHLEHGLKSLDFLKTVLE